MTEPLVRVVRGAPDDTELAALTVVVSAIVTAAAVTAQEQVRSWSNPRAMVRPQISHGWGAWRASGMPG